MTEINPAELGALQAFVGRLIPDSAEHGVPGADDPAIFAEVQAELSSYWPMLGDLMAQLGRMGQATIAEQPLDALMGQVATSPVFGLIAVAVIQAYYRDDRVVRSLGMEARPPFPKGYTIPQGDLSLLDPVKARGPIWRDAG